ncbi:MAG: cupredoxin domain-containing protein [Chloroflexi bacterium]|nr:cupredoxin domain-containing protein [Chloroflexota bacterium]
MKVSEKVARRRTLVLVVYALIIVACGGQPTMSTPTAVTVPSPTATQTPALSPSPTPSATSTPLPSTPTPTPGPTQVDLSNYMFTPGILEVEAGKVAKFELIGDGLEHTFTIKALGVDISVPERPRSKTVEFLVPQAASGDLALTCSFHELAGMVGTLRVK